ncbi:NUDIX hydrolase [Tunicatimonas pelagia]|uniref:NUDIX hydrolase n=1 Tax=Tunicatimonas pelagia TaxID=931531 RepID=UPI00266718AA|nr:CoA pyrophosphatase [Tunicatimonas pelagia]WKN43724.1 CoA pyrophosphatase [Tunicatimonas pelagia]
MDFSDELISSLRERLRQPLPGWQAQQRMATEHHRTARLLPLPNAKRAGVLILLYPGSEQRLYFPLIQRPHYDGAHSGQIAFPGGKVEPEDASMVDTALRETREEIGVEVLPDQVLGQLSDLYIPVSKFIVSPVVAFVREPPTYQADPVEVAATLDVLAQSFLQPENRTVKEIQVRGTTLQAPAYLVQKQIIWGATAMILAEFFAVLQQIDNQ